MPHIMKLTSIKIGEYENEFRTHQPYSAVILFADVIRARFLF